MIFICLKPQYKIVIDRDAAASRQFAPEVIMVMFMSPLDEPRRGWDLWRFASLIPSGCRLPPIHKAMGGHASRGPTTAGAFAVTWQKRGMKMEWKSVEEMESRGREGRDPETCRVE